MIQVLGKNNVKQLCVLQSASIYDAMSVLDKGGRGIVLIVTDFNTLQLLGILTDGDIRRAILNHVDIKKPVLSIANTLMVTGTPDLTDAQTLNIFLYRKINHLPIVDSKNFLQDLILLKDIYSYQEFLKPSMAVIMAGGKGSRLYPLTANTPKPMLTINDRPLLELIIQKLKQHGVTEFYISVREHKNQIIDYFKDGKDLNINIKYLEEDEIKNTAGALSLIPETPTKPFIVMNGDILTTINFNELYKYHLDQHALCTIVSTRQEYDIAYGVLTINANNEVTEFLEKPTHYYHANAGIYVISPEVLRLIPKTGEFSIPDLLRLMFEQKMRVAAFSLYEYWKDIGQPADYYSVQNKKI